MITRTSPPSSRLWFLLRFLDLQRRKQKGRKGIWKKRSRKSLHWPRRPIQLKRLRIRKKQSRNGKALPENRPRSRKKQLLIPRRLLPLQKRKRQRKKELLKKILTTRKREIHLRLRNKCFKGN